MFVAQVLNPVYGQEEINCIDFDAGKQNLEGGGKETLSLQMFGALYKSTSSYKYN